MKTEIETLVVKIGLVGKHEQHEAQYRVLIKRILRSLGQQVDNDAKNQTLETMLFNVSHAVPVLVAKKIDSQWNEAAKAWEDGNNSGNCRILERKEIECDEIRNAAIRVMETVFKVSVDFPGLYPSFMVNGFSEHSTLGAIKAALVKETTLPV
jgi:hypothetical protein